MTVTLSGTEPAAGIRAGLPPRQRNWPPTGRRPGLAVVVGRPNLITAEHGAEDAVVVDVGTNPAADGGLVGDVDAVSVAGRVAGLTPVPGGVGPVTTALLLQHTVASAHG